MDSTDIVILLILLVIVGSACFYIIKAKRNGEKCIGCPMSKQCSTKNHEQTQCNCGCSSKKNK